MERIEELLRKILDEKEYVEGDADEGNAWDYKQAAIILSALKNEGYLEILDVDPLAEPLETHCIIVKWTDKAGDGELEAPLVGDMLKFFDYVIIDDARWCLFKKIYEN